MVQTKRNSICLFYPPLQLQVFAVSGDTRSSSFTAVFSQHAHKNLYLGIICACRVPEIREIRTSIVFIRFWVPKRRSRLGRKSKVIAGVSPAVSLAIAAALP